VNALQTLVDAADDAALLRAVDGLCASRDWDRLVDLGRRCRDAVELGKQLWPVAAHIDYRLALEAPAPYAGGVLRPGAGRFALGPLTEVAASRHPWAALEPHIADPASAATVAQERVLRGEDLRAAAVLAELPLRRAPFEPDYPLPRYRDREVHLEAPAVTARALPPPRAVAAGTPIAGDPAARALRDSVEHWSSQSSGTVTAVAVEGTAAAAVGALSPAAAIVDISVAEALAWLQWAAASGGAHGPRRGGASGRFAAWFAAVRLAGLPWPDQPDDDFVSDLGRALTELRWHRWAPPGPEAGWLLRLAVADPRDGLAWAVDARDERTDALEAG
jgi:hypothetical protein